MKKVLIMILVAIGLTAFAQEKKLEMAGNRMEKLTPDQLNEHRMKRITKELDLNEKQQKEFGALIAERSAKRQALMTERKANKAKEMKPSSEDRTARATKRSEEEKAMNDKIRKILTPDQFKKWETFQNERKDKMRARREQSALKIPGSKE